VRLQLRRQFYRSERDLDFWPQSGLSKAALELNRQGSRAPGQTTPIGSLVLGIACAALGVAETYLGIWAAPDEFGRGNGSSVVLLFAIAAIVVFIGVGLSSAYVVLARTQRVEWVEGKMTKRWVSNNHWSTRLLYRNREPGRGWINVSGRAFMVSRRVFLAAPEGSVCRVYHVRGLMVNLEVLGADGADEVNGG
jgi:hypothetical protein